ncbi:hypothetical protein JNUCC23_09130 [Peribacillus sp. JNUCC 23]
MKVKETFNDYVGNYDISTSVRYINKMLADVYLPHGIKVPITYTAEVDIRQMKIPITLEFHLTEDGKLSAEWRIYWFANKDL